MIRVALRGMAQRPLRTVLTAIAIVLGVAMMSAAFTATDTMRSAADSLSTDAYKGTDAVVSAPVAFDSSDGDIGGSQPIPASTLERVKQVPGVDVAVGDILEQAKIIGRDGKPVGDGPWFGIGYDAKAPGGEKVNPLKLQQGRWATGPGEVVIDVSTASKQHKSIGDRVSIATDAPAAPFRVVGLARFGTVETLGTASVAVFDLRAAQTLLDRPNGYDDILVTAKPGVSAPVLRAQLKDSLGPRFSVRSAEEQDRFTFDGLKQFVSIIKYILLAFGGIAILVGAFTIFNALSITVAQRTRELALGRALGASRRQVLRSVVAEAFAMGVAASAVGLGLGVLLAKGVMALFTASGIDLPRASLQFETRTVVVSMLVGTIVTVLAGLVPALRATRVAPVEAMREVDVFAAARPSRKTTVAAAVISAIGLAALAYGLFGKGLSAGDRLFGMLGGSLALFVGTGLASPRLVQPISRFVAWPSRRFGGVAGRLASRNTVRNPGRTAGMAAALMIGVALVTFVGVLGHGLKTSATDRIGSSVSASHVLAAEDGYSDFSADAARSVGEVDGVTGVAVLRQREVRAFGKSAQVDSVDPAVFSKAYSYDWKTGSDATLRSLSGNGVLVTDSFAKTHKLKVGSAFSVTAPTGRHVGVVVRGIDKTPAIDVLGMGAITMSASTFARSFPPTPTRLAFVSTNGHVATDSLKGALRAFPGTEVRTTSAFADKQAKELDPLLGMLYVLLGLAIVVSVFGIINTLILSVVERTREIGLLRAVGMSRRQIRRTIRHESVVTALIGAALGIGIGLMLSALVCAALAGDGLVFAIPVGSLVAFVTLSVVLGVLAAALPARRAAKLDVLGALAHT
jgi:putative ABC transport system permease protein